MNVVSYCRVSTASQTIDPQRLELQSYAKMKGWTIEREYSDVMSGTKARRPGMDALLADIYAGKVKIVIAFKIDRIARSMINLLDLIRIFDKHGVALIIPGSDIDTSQKSPTRKLMMNMLASFAEFERDIIVDRTLAGLANARSQGRIGGRKKGERMKDLPIEEARALVDAGESYNQVAKRLNIPLTTMRRRLAA